MYNKEKGCFVFPLSLQDYIRDCLEVQFSKSHDELLVRDLILATPNAYAEIDVKVDVDAPTKKMVSIKGIRLCYD